jgi:hypothetical protein
VNFLNRMDLLVIHAEVVELSAMCLSWVLQNCSKDTYKAAVETLVGFFAIEHSSTPATHTALALTVKAHAGEGGGVHNPQEVAADVFSLPEPVLHILLSDLHTLCKHQEVRSIWQWGMGPVRGRPLPQPCRPFPKRCRVYPLPRYV